ncbi:MAG TPA: FAD-linked oxidase C-terminal domain-containing protein [candidate division Zixibacteria bacterium]|nr:FAD-linked oxidase C-terminal domain-containing protein [candidate division Zixibacteria bacterium]
MNHDIAPEARDLAAELQKRIEGEVRFDRYTRLLYSTDASIYQIEPIGVIVPRHKGDVQAAIEVANRFKAPLLPRGGGTSLAGQTVGRALVLDFSKYMNRVLEVNREELWCRVQPGLVQDELNAHVRPMGLQFGPDTSTANRATIGGMIGNNSAGAHSLAYGKTLDHVLELTVLLADGSEVVLEDLAGEEVERKSRLDTPEGRIYREIARIAREHRQEIVARYPRIMRRVSGYNLDEFVKPQPFNLSRIVVGSEGTLGTVVEAKMRLVPKPKWTAMAVIHFHSDQEALECSQAILQTRPYAMESTDRMVLSLARGNIEQSRKLWFVQGDPDSLLMVEYAGESEREVREQVERLEELRRRERIGYAATLAFKPEEVKAIWGVRKAGLGLLLGIKGDKKPIAFVEDTAVEPARLPEFIRRFRKIIEDHDAVAGYYGHCSVGCMHIRPLIDLKRPEGVRKMVSIANAVLDLVLEFDGALSGEHGDGLARSHFNEKLFGPTLYQAFREVKRAFDPDNLMNPGKIVDAPAMTESLRISPEYRTWEPDTTLDFSGQGGFARAVEMCSGMGECRKKLEGTMCPSYMATLDEEHSTRGRANALRSVLSGKVPKEDFTGERLHQVLDLCLECKACKAECPSNVDMAKLKYEFLDHYHRANGLPLRNRVFGAVERINRIGSRFAPVSNWIARSRWNRWLLEKWAGIDRRRPLPEFARESFEDWFGAHAPEGDGSKGEVVLFHDTFNNFNTPDVAIAAARFLERAGYRLVRVEKRCCGRPMISKGMLRAARDHAIWNVDRLAEFAGSGAAIVGLEPSCLLTLRDEYPELVRTPEARRVADNSFLLEEFVVRERDAGRLSLRFAGGGRKALLHGHCHQRALAGTGATVAALRWAGYEVSEVDSGCCGMAGSFGFEKEHYDLSIAIGRRRLAPAVEAAPPEVEIVAPGISCRQQIDHLTGRKARHPAELLWEALADERPAGR